MLSILTAGILNISSHIAQLLPAQPCFLCGTLTHQCLCCAACTRDLPRHLGPVCRICATPLPSGEVCGHCLRQPPAFAHTVAAFHYAFPLDSLIKALKFNEQLILAHFLADRLAESITVRPDCILALPLHAVRLRERGFNQSQLLAERLSSTLHIPLLANIALRVRDTPPQSSLPWQARKRNMRKAFALSAAADIQGLHIAIVDDVMTTGASMDALAHLLREGGAAEVSAWVVARTLPHRGNC